MTATRRAGRRITAAMAALVVVVVSGVVGAPAAVAADAVVSDVTVSTVSRAPYSTVPMAMPGFTIGITSADAGDTVTLSMTDAAGAPVRFSAVPTVTSATTVLESDGSAIATLGAALPAGGTLSVTGVRIVLDPAVAVGDVTVHAGAASAVLFTVTAVSVAAPAATVPPNTSSAVGYTALGDVTLSVLTEVTVSDLSLTVTHSSAAGQVSLAGTLTRLVTSSGALVAAAPIATATSFGRSATWSLAPTAPVTLTAGTYLVRGLSASAFQAGQLSVSVAGDAGTATASTTIPVAVSDGTRIAGADRYATSALIAARYWAANSASSTVIVANGEESKNGADALAASFLGAVKNAPVVLVTRDSIPSSVLTALNSRAAALPSEFTEIIVLGDQSSVSAGVVTQFSRLVGSSGDVRRVAGADRFATAAAVAAQGTAGRFQSSVSSGSRRTAFLANGWKPVDALVAGPVAYAKGLPVLLTDGGTLSAAAEQAIRDGAIQHVIVLGGTGSISASVVSAVESLTVGGTRVSTQRLAGATRFETAKAINDLAVRSTGTSGLGMTVSQAYLSNGWGFADALSGGPLAGSTRGLIVPVDSTLPAASQAFLTANASAITAVTALGGTARVSDPVLAVATAAAR